MAQPIQPVKLCSHCANSVALDALKCPYCKADLKPDETHEWPERAEQTGEPVASAPLPAAINRRASTIVIAAAMLVVMLLAIFLVVGQRQASDSIGDSVGKLDEFREKDQKIETLEAELAKLRARSNDSQLDEFKARLEETNRDLTATQRKLADANREIERLTSSGVAAAPAPRRRADPLPAPATPARRAAEPGIYETRRPTAVYEEPYDSARVVTRIAKSTRVTVVRSVGDWLEVRSKHGNPPGFIRSDDAMLVTRAN